MPLRGEPETGSRSRVLPAELLDAYIKEHGPVGCVRARKRSGGIDDARVRIRMLERRARSRLIKKTSHEICHSGIECALDVERERG
jgi:hypothetical protein